MKPVRVTEDQARLLFAPRGDRVAPTSQSLQKRARKPRDSLPENIVEGQILGLLRARGWLVERQQAGTVLGIGPVLGALERGEGITREWVGGRATRIGARGRCDWVAVRARPELGAGACVRMEVEVKAPGRKPTPEQLDYIRGRNACGFLAGWFDRALPGEPGRSQPFSEWYNERFVPRNTREA